MSIETEAVHAGERDKNRQHRSITIPIAQTATYYFENTQQIKDFYAGHLPGIKYGRYGCPTQHAVEEKITILENTERALIFSSGMAALTTTIFALVKHGDHVLYSSDCYRNTRKFFADILPQLGIHTTEVPINDITHLNRYTQDNTVLIFSEVPTNPFLRVIDLQYFVKSCQEKKLISIIDSTFATPINLQPALYGVDLVLHSGTKYLGGHHDLFD